MSANPDSTCDDDLVTELLAFRGVNVQDGLVASVELEMETCPEGHQHYRVYSIIREEYLDLDTAISSVNIGVRGLIGQKFAMQRINLDD